MNQDDYHGAVIILLIAILAVSVVALWVLASPESFNAAIAKLNEPAPNILDQAQAVADQAATGDHAFVYGVFITIAVCLIVISLGALIYRVTKLGASNSDNKTKSATNADDKMS